MFCKKGKKVITECSAKMSRRQNGIVTAWHDDRMAVVYFAVCQLSQFKSGMSNINFYLTLYFIFIKLQHDHHHFFYFI